MEPDSGQREVPLAWILQDARRMFCEVDTSRAWAEVDLDALEHNLRIVRSRIGARVALVVVIKADAYGHGAVAVARHVLSCEASGPGDDMRGPAFGVATCAEALELREAGVHGRVLVLGATLEREARPAVLYGVEVAISCVEDAARLEQAARGLGRPARVHVVVDTGMGRLGADVDGALALLARVHATPELELAGIMTHLAPTDGIRGEEGRAQLERFDALVRTGRARRLVAGRACWIHAENSACVLAGEGARYDAVRVGLAVYGLPPHPALPGHELRAVLSVRARVALVKDVPTGHAVGYDGTWRAARPTRLATLPIGYDDGLPWRLGNRGEVLVRGQRAPIVGRVSMDYATVDVTEVSRVTAGDVATIVGDDGDECIGADDVARWAGTVPYDITCSLGKRVGRVQLVRAHASNPPEAVV